MAKTSKHKQSTLPFASVKKPTDNHAGKQKGTTTPGAAQATRSTKGATQTVQKQLTVATAGKPEQRVTRSAAAASAPTTVAASTRGKSKEPAGRSTSNARGSKVAATSSPYKAAKRSNPTNNKQSAGAVKYYDRYEVHGDEYKVGDAVYVVATSDQSQLPDDDAEDLCVLCNRGHKSHTILECDRCLAGFHMGCLNPPLKAIPKGTWLCEDCHNGEVPGSKRPLRTTYEKFLFAPKDKPVLTLGLITGFVKNRGGDGEVEFMCRYFCRPEDTHLGRQEHNGRREVFLTNTEHYEPVLGIFGGASICSAADFEQEEGTDVYMCEYEYDEQWKRFRRHVVSKQRKTAKVEEDDDSEEEDSDFDAAAESVDSDDEECVRDRTFKPIYALWAEKGLLPAGFRGRPKQPKRSGALNRQTATITIKDDEDDVVGAAGVLELVGGGTSSIPAPASSSNALVAAKKALALAAPPAVLPCRDNEKQQLTTFVKSAITEEGGSGPGVLYVCGVPGTGKTACIKEVLATVRPQALERGVQLVFLNALSLPSPTHVYCKLWERLTGQHVGPGRALAALEAMFAAQASGTGASSSKAAAKRACMTLLVVDEIDVLITKDQSVLYNLFEWPVRPGSRLAVIGISNTHDLDDRVLPRISSRLASAKLAFNAYTVQQLTEIVDQRLEAAGCKHLMERATVQLATRKVAASSGDVRRALELLRRALDIAEAERRRQAAPVLRPEDPAAKDCVKVKHVQVAIGEMFTSPHMQLLRGCSRLEKLALTALLLQMRASSKPDASVHEIHDRLVSHVSLLVPDARCEPVALCRVVFEMAAKRLLVTSPTWQALKARVALNVHKDDVCMAIKDDVDLGAVHGQLA